MRKFTCTVGRIDAPDDADPAELLAWCKDSIRHPDSFAYFGGREKMFVTWSMGPVIEHRDSDACDRSNAACLRKLLDSDASLADDYEIDKASHWAVGWVEHLTFRTFEDEAQTTPTRLACILFAWFEYLRDVYPIADEDHFSEVERAEADEVWERCYSTEERLNYIREHRQQFDFRDFADLLGCARGKYFAGYASELLH